MMKLSRTALFLTCYEARDIEQIITAQDKIDAYFDAKTSGLNDAAKAKLKSKWTICRSSTAQGSGLKSSPKILSQILILRSAFAGGNGNAILVSDSIYSACRYYEIFQSRGIQAVCDHYVLVPQAGNLRTEDENSGGVFEV